ncbi:MAG: FAD-binding protein [Bacteroidales bacterium]
MVTLNSKIPEGPLEEKWTKYKANARRVNPANKKKLDIIVVGTGISEHLCSLRTWRAGYNVKVFCYQDTPRRAHSVAAQEASMPAKNYKNDGDSVYQLFYDVIKGGDFRAREANVYRIAEVEQPDHRPLYRHRRSLCSGIRWHPYHQVFSVGCRCQEPLFTRSDRPAGLPAHFTSRQVKEGMVTMYPRRDMLDIVVVDGKARGNNNA